MTSKYPPSNPRTSFVADLFRFGPAATMERELAIGALTLVAFVVMVYVLRPTTAMIGIVGAVLAVYLVARFAWGVQRTWKARP